MVDGKITLGGLRATIGTPAAPPAQNIPTAPVVQQNVSRPTEPPKPKAPLKKQNEVVVAVYVDGQEFYLRYSVPLSSSLMSGQRSKDYMANAFNEMLSERFGKVTRL